MVPPGVPRRSSAAWHFLTLIASSVIADPHGSLQLIATATASASTAHCGTAPCGNRRLRAAHLRSSGGDPISMHRWGSRLVREIPADTSNPARKQRQHIRSRASAVAADPILPASSVSLSEDPRPVRRYKPVPLSQRPQMWPIRPGLSGRPPPSACAGLVGAAGRKFPTQALSETGGLPLTSSAKWKARAQPTGSVQRRRRQRERCASAAGGGLDLRCSTQH